MLGVAGVAFQAFIAAFAEATPFAPVAVSAVRMDAVGAPCQRGALKTRYDERLNDCALTSFSRRRGANDAGTKYVGSGSIFCPTMPRMYFMNPRASRAPSRYASQLF